MAIIAPEDRLERILAGEDIAPVSRLEKFAAAAAGTYELPEDLTPVSRLEYFLSQISGGGGGGGSTDVKETFMPPLPWYSLDKHYSNDNYQVFEAPPGVVYDKVLIPNEYLSQFGNQRDFLTTFFQNSIVNKNYYCNYRTAITSYYTNDSNTASIQQHYFDECTSLKEIIINRDSVKPLSNINALANTPFASGGSGGTLYVPAAQISAYQAASNWSTILGYANNQIKSIEGSIWEVTA